MRVVFDGLLVCVCMIVFVLVLFCCGVFRSVLIRLVDGLLAFCLYVCIVLYVFWCALICFGLFCLKICF